MRKEQRQPSNTGFVRPAIMAISGISIGANTYQSSGSIFLAGLYGLGTMIIVALFLRMMENNYIFVCTLILVLYLWFKFS